MERTPDIHQELPNPLRMDRCPDCGYLLTGLRPCGQCPECGAAYDIENMLVLYGYGYDKRANRANTRRFAWIPLGLFIAFLVVSHLVPMIQSWCSGGVATPRQLPPDAALIFVTLFGIATALLRRRRITRDAPLPAQLRIAPTGCAQRDGIGPARLLPWGPKRRLRIEKLGPRRYRILSWRVGDFIFFGRQKLVDFEFEADDSTVAALHQRIARWQGSVP